MTDERALVGKRTARTCPSCGPGSALVVRARRSDGHLFLGCERWSPGSETHCEHTEALPEAIKMRLLGAAVLPGFE